LIIALAAIGTGGAILLAKRAATASELAFAERARQAALRASMAKALRAPGAPANAAAIAAAGEVTQTLDMERLTRDRSRVTPHWGADIGNAPRGTPIYAAKAGIVHKAAVRSGYGNCVEISHGEESTLYAHLDSMLVSRGQEVFGGQQIGTMGNTGFPGMGVHLHFEVHPTPVPHFGASRRLEPVIWLRNNGINPTATMA